MLSVYSYNIQNSLLSNVVYNYLELRDRLKFSLFINAEGLVSVNIFLIS